MSQRTRFTPTFRSGGPASLVYWIHHALIIPDPHPESLGCEYHREKYMCAMQSSPCDKTLSQVNDYLVEGRYLMGAAVLACCYLVQTLLGVASDVMLELPPSWRTNSFLYLVWCTVMAAATWQSKGKENLFSSSEGNH